jgi:hypothetical protein
VRSSQEPFHSESLSALGTRVNKISRDCDWNSPRPPTTSWRQPVPCLPHLLILPLLHTSESPPYLPRPALHRAASRHSVPEVADPTATMPDQRTEGETWCGEGHAMGMLILKEMELAS